MPEVAFAADALAAGHHRGAALDCVLGELRHRRQPARIGQRAHLRAFDRAVADLEPGGVFGQCGGKVVLDALVHQEAGRRDADLAGVAELGGAGGLDGQRDVGVLGDDHRCMAAQLHGHALHVLAGQRGQLLAHRRRAGEGDLADDGVCDQVAGDLGGVAVDQAQHAGRKAGVVEGPDQLRRGGRSFFRRLHQHRAAGRQCRSHLAHHLVDREVPGREGSDRTDRVLQYHLPHGQVAARRNDAAVDPEALFREPLNDVGGGHRLALGLSRRLALLLRQHRADGAGALAHQAGGLAHDLAAVGGRHVAPGLEALLRGLQGLVQVGLAGMGDAADFLAGRRVVDGKRAAVGGVQPLAGDEQLGVGVGHGDSCGARVEASLYSVANPDGPPPSGRPRHRSPAAASRSPAAARPAGPRHSPSERRGGSCSRDGGATRAKRLSSVTTAPSVSSRRTASPGALSSDVAEITPQRREAHTCRVKTAIDRQHLAGDVARLR